MAAHCKVNVVVLQISTPPDINPRIRRLAPFDRVSLFPNASSKRKLTGRSLFETV